MDNAEGYAYAYAGGIAGYVEYGAIISDCFFKGECRASAVEGVNYQFSDGIAAHTEPAGTAFIHTNGTLIRNCYSPEDHKVIDDAFIKTALGWEDADWKFNGDGTPDINREEAQKTYEITVMIGNTEVTKLTVENMYVPMTYWYALALTSEDGEGLNEFIGSGKNRTYGYYFDAELTQRVPNGFIPTRAVTLYAAYADYTEVTGDYYIEGTDGSYFTLDENGYLSYRDGARNSISTYVYDGRGVAAVIVDVCNAALGCAIMRVVGLAFIVGHINIGHATYQVAVFQIVDRRTRTRDGVFVAVQVGGHGRQCRELRAFNKQQQRNVTLR